MFSPEDDEWKLWKFWQSVSLWQMDGTWPAWGDSSSRCPLLLRCRWELLGGKTLFDFSSWWQPCCFDEYCSKRALFMQLWIRAWSYKPYFIRFVFLDQDQRSLQSVSLRSNSYKGGPELTPLAWVVAPRILGLAVRFLRAVKVSRIERVD